MGTFSIVARCSKTKSLGVGVCTGSPTVRTRVPHVEAGVGAIATQGYTNIMYGVRGLQLLKKGFHPRKALEIMLEEDLGKDLRQVAIIDFLGRKAAHTGIRTEPYSGHIIGEDYVVAGNLITSSRVLDKMSEEFEAHEKTPLTERLIYVLEAGDEAGGDRRGNLSAAVVVAEANGKIIDLSVDEHSNPIKELKRLYEELIEG